MPNYDLHKLHAEYNTKNMRVLLSRLLKKNPEFRDRTIVTYEVRTAGTCGCRCASTGTRCGRSS